jgi:hypothetical protein
MLISPLMLDLEETVGDVADATAPDLFSTIIIAVLLNMAIHRLFFLRLSMKQPKLSVLPTAAAV